MTEKWITDCTISWHSVPTKPFHSFLLFLCAPTKYLALGWHGQGTISSESPYLELLIFIDFLSENYVVLESFQPPEADLKWTTLAIVLPETVKAREIPSLNGLDFQRKSFWKDLWMSSVEDFFSPIRFLKLKPEYRSLAGRGHQLPSPSTTEVKQKEKLLHVPSWMSELEEIERQSLSNEHSW